MRIADVIGVLKARGFHDGAADIEDVLAELAEPSGHGGAVDRRHPTAGGLSLLDVDIANVLRNGLEVMIEAHRAVEALRTGQPPAPAAKR